MGANSKHIHATAKYEVDVLQKTAHPVLAKPEPRPEIHLEPHAHKNNLVRVSMPQTALKRNSFLLRHDKFFKPLLPNSNFYTKLSAAEVAAAMSNGIFPPKQIMQQPSLIKNGQMKEYQLRGLSFLIWLYENGMGGILGDEMGLGKTLQTFHSPLNGRNADRKNRLSLFAHIRESGHKGPFLVICPLSVLPAWMNEIARWTPSFKAIKVHGIVAERARVKGLCRENSYDIYVTNYEQFVLERHWFARRVWKYVVVDEGHCLKNDQTQLAHHVGTLNAEYRLLLTGTPLQNSLHELWALFHFLYPDVFPSTTADAFKAAFNLTKGTYDTKFIDAASALLSKIMLRRMKADMDEIKLPPKEELLIYVPLTPLQRFWYKRMITKQIDTRKLLEEVFGTQGTSAPMAIRDGTAEGGNDWQRLQNLLIQLLRVCDHPYTLRNVMPDPYILGDHIIQGSGKIILLDKLLPKLLNEGHRVLLFSGFTAMLDVCEDFLLYRGWKYARLDGSTTPPRRALDIRLFNQANSPYQCYLISTKAGGLGINLTGADTAPTPNLFAKLMGSDIQAMARCHRIGQTKPVTVYRLITQNSVEEQSLSRLAKKLYLSVKVTTAATNPQSASTGDNTAPKFTKGELVKLLRSGATALRDTMGDTWGAKPIEEIIRTSRERQRQMEEILIMSEEEVDSAEKELLKDAERIQCSLFEGKVHAREWKEITDDWKNLKEKRQRNERTVLIDGYEVNKESLACRDWEAFPTFSANYVPPPKRKRREFEHQDWCHFCREGGELALCTGCPRVFHAKCAGYTQKEIKALSQFYCPQHHCSVCERNTGQAGGMLFRCQTCADSFCEDCLPQEGHLEGIGASLPEFEVLGYPENKQAYYIRCPSCVDILTNPRDDNEKTWGKEWILEIERAKKELEGDEQDKEMDVDEQVASLSVRETIDLTKSETQSTMTTDPEEYNDAMEIERNPFPVKREYVIID